MTYYALRGDNMYYFRSNLKYNVIKPAVKKARKEKDKDSKFKNVPYAFYLNLIADVGLYEGQLTMANTIRTTIRCSIPGV